MLHSICGMVKSWIDAPQVVEWSSIFINPLSGMYIYIYIHVYIYNIHQYPIISIKYSHQGMHDHTPHTMHHGTYTHSPLLSTSYVAHAD